jgi:hypothetical protein
VYSTQVFYYVQRQIVVFQTGNSPRTYMPVYSKTLTLHKGVDNAIQFQFLNQAQKSVDITGKEITCRIISYDGNRQLFQKSLTLTTPLTGIAVLEISPADIEDIPSQRCYYSLELPVGSFNFPVFVDPAAGARGDIDIVDSVLPRFVNSVPVTIPTQLYPNTVLSVTGNICTVLAGTTVTYSTSPIVLNDASCLTVQSTYIGYYGNVTVEGSTLPDSGWYTINTYSYSNATSTQGYTIQGYHPYVRLTFTSNIGSVANLLAR